MMPTFQENVDLLPYNTFRIKASASKFIAIHSEEDVQALLADEFLKNKRYVILGGGSNILLTGDYDGLVIKNEIKGIKIVREGEETITLKIGAGENWHQTVLHCVNHNYGGIENLSLIPGTVGAAPMQNIGAYGVEVKEVLEMVEAIDLSTGKVETFTNSQCNFGYRESIFKHELKNKYFISSVTLTLTKRDHHYNTSYGAIKDVLAESNTPVSVKAISDAVIAIRKSKLPDPALIGNAGSFFKNPSLDVGEFESLRMNYPNIPSFPGENSKVKVPAAWLIEQCGWKGKTLDNIGVHKQQALVLVNYGGGSGEKIWQLALDIQSSVKEKFGITLHPEVNMITH